MKNRKCQRKTPIGWEKKGSTQFKKLHSIYLFIYQKTVQTVYHAVENVMEQWHTLGIQLQNFTLKTRAQTFNYGNVQVN